MPRLTPKLYSACAVTMSLPPTSAPVLRAAPISVEVNEPIGGTWRILKSTHAYTKSDAWAAQFLVPVAADSTTTLTYRVRVTY